MNLYYRIHLINGDIITAWEPVKEDGKDLITRFGEADPDDLLEIGDNASSMAFSVSSLSIKLDYFCNNLFRRNKGILPITGVPGVLRIVAQNKISVFWYRDHLLLKNRYGNGLHVTDFRQIDPFPRAAGDALNNQDSILLEDNDVPCLKLPEKPGSYNDTVLLQCRLHGRCRYITDQKNKAQNQNKNKGQTNW